MPHRRQGTDAHAQPKTKHVREEHLGEELIIEYDVAVDLDCNACGGPLMVLGTLGKTTHYRCRNCGMDQEQLG